MDDHEMLSRAGPAFATALGFLLLLPIGEGIIGYFRKLGAAVCLTCLSLRYAEPLPKDAFLSVWVATQFLAGFAASFSLYILLAIYELWGEFFDFARGQTIAHAYAPDLEVNGAPMGQLLKHFGIIYVLLSGIFDRALLVCLQNSGGDISSAISVSQEILQFGFVAMLPLAWLFLLIDGTGAVVSKLIPSLSLSAELFLLKTCLGFACLAALLRLGVLPMYFSR